MKIDPRSDRIALHYTGSEAGEPAISGVPARDLTENDIARLVDIEHPNARGGGRQAATDSLLERLTEGPYRKTAGPRETTEPAEPSATTPTEG